MTTIRDIRAIPLERKLDRIFQGGTYQIDSRYTLIVEVELANGVVGRTFGGDEEKYQKEIARCVNGPFRNLLVGKDVFAVERHWDNMFHCESLGLANRGIHTLDLANKSIIMQAIAAVDIGLWDAGAKVLGLSLCRMLGGFGDRVPVIAIGGYYGAGKGEAELAEELHSYIGMGLAGIKLKVGRLTPKEDAERVRFVREIVGPHFVVACDANQAWTAEQSIAFCRAVREYDVRWIEEPVVWYDQLSGLARVRQLGGIPVNAGQGEISRYGCRDLIQAGAVDILNVDATIAGGVTEWRRIAGMAAANNVSMAHHEEPQVAVHLLASIPHGLFVEIFPNPERDPMWFELPLKQPEIKNGYMRVPDRPGLGIELNPAVISKFRAAS
ncbi:MAG: mandelate racemase/muconate lactonizing enzyme family protein [Acidobacteriaceae bacterium]|nr:mandelate racemase/muconate lactonizing enzyme family protein [Acidobacteriaceae bacterium]MBV9305676.1 mandelate racemase/muconate lactonizing enzyme family protein [Acidobacteriaceae bacterium]